jgi:hypothetical protein
MKSDTQIVRNRRARLREWFDRHPIPEKEKSYISQLINGKASFGEKAAERLESEYGMGKGYLDADSASNVLDFASRKGLSGFGCV